MTVQSTFDLAATEPPPRRAGPWLFWGTTLWGVAACAVFAVINMAGLGAILIHLNPPANLTTPELTQILYAHMGLVLAVTLAGTVAAAGILALAIRLSRIGARDYLGLVWPQAKYVKIGLSGLAVLYVIFSLADHFLWSRQSAAALAMYRQALLGDPVGFAVMLAIVAPLTEELTMRGFFLRGWAASRIGPFAAILLTTAIWTAMHVQYDLTGLANVFCIGLLFGWIRLRSGSTLLTMLLHATQNIAALITLVVYIWLGVTA